VRAIKTRLFLALLALSIGAGAVHAAKGGLPRIADKVRRMDECEGLLRFHVDRSAGRLWLEVPPPEGANGIAMEMLYVEGLRSGLGSNPVGLDRGRLGETRWVALRRMGPRVLFEQLNPRYRARSDDPAERRAARESFATSVLWAADVVAEDPDGRSLVDFTSFLVRDAHGIAAVLRESEQGEFKLDPARSAIDLEACLAFPDNVELESLLTFAGTRPGGDVRETAPFPEAVTFVHHTSLIRLPDDHYEPRRFDPRAGSFAIGFHDYSVRLEDPYKRSWIVRHRLKKVDPTAVRSRAVEPIVFYVDRGAPEPVRSALVEGASWWADAFDGAGFVDAFRVELLPEGVHPLDVRYNVVEWVHRSTRGWSYGGGVIDPRTGEMIKGHVRLGSLRVRQDRLLFEGLAGTGESGTGTPDDPVELSLARIRQLAAHEVGHALGFSHNFAASTYAGRASVMDYPAPLVGFDARGELDFSRAYGTGVGVWDKHAVRYAYSEFAPGVDEQTALESIVREGIDAGYLFLTDSAARPASASDPRANLWDNGDDPVAALELTLRVRRQALDRFGEGNVRPGTPLAHLEEVLATVYFHHRFQLEAAVKVVGGMEFHYAVRGDGQWPTRIVSAKRQRRALEVVLGLLDPVVLDLGDGVLDLLAPRPQEEPNREMFASSTSPAFDLQGAAATAAAAVLDGLLQPERLGRMAEFHRRDVTMPGVGELLDSLVGSTFGKARSSNGRHAVLERLVETVVVDRLISLAADDTVRPVIRASGEAALRRILNGLDHGESARAESAHADYLGAWITRFLDRSAAPSTGSWLPARMPPGSPIGAARMDCSVP
jgi:hypothetical protein